VPVFRFAVAVNASRGGQLLSGRQRPSFVSTTTFGSLIDCFWPLS